MLSLHKSFNDLYDYTVVNVRVEESDFISAFTNEYFKSQDVIYFKATASDKYFLL